MCSDVLRQGVYFDRALDYLTVKSFFGLNRWKNNDYFRCFIDKLPSGHWFLKVGAIISDKRP